MNPHFGFKRWSVRAGALLAALASLVFALGCGSSGMIQSLGGGFSKASLKGQYVIALTGIGVDQPPFTGVDSFSETVVLTADGNGNLTVTVDDFDQVGGPYGGPENLSGTYSISSDGTGGLVFNYTPATTNYAITMIDDNHFYLIEQDILATASGYGEKQDTAAFATAPSGPFVFKAHNLQASSRVGGITITGKGISGTEDLLNFGFLETSNALTGTMSAPRYEHRAWPGHSERRHFVQLLHRECEQIPFPVEECVA